jgi:hypothetical protein
MTDLMHRMNRTGHSNIDTALRALHLKFYLENAVTASLTTRPLLSCAAISRGGGGRGEAPYIGAYTIKCMVQIT